MTKEDNIYYNYHVYNRLVINRDRRERCLANPGQIVLLYAKHRLNGYIFKLLAFIYALQGDSGSGLVGQGKLIGVASWVEDDATVCRPGAIVVFSRVAAVRDWIRQVTGV